MVGSSPQEIPDLAKVGYLDNGIDRRPVQERLSASRQWWMVGALTILSMLAYIDKNVVVLMLKPIQLDLGISAAQATLAIGTAFAAANLIVGLPSGWLADRADRRIVIWAAVSLWSVMAVLCGFATSFLMLMLVRGGVGFAEGLLPPSCYSFIKDGVSPARRARALSVFAMSILVGTGVAFLLGGLLIGFLTSHDFSTVPLFGKMRPWAQAVALIGLAGVPVSLLVFTIRDPGRLTSMRSQDEPRLRDAFGHLIARRGVFIPLAVFSVASAMLTNSINIWVAPLLSAHFGLSPSQIGPPVGLMLLTVGPIGLFSAGAAIDYLDRRKLAGAPIVAVLVSALLLIFATIQPLAPSQTLAWSYLCVAALAANSYLVVTSALIIKLLPSAVTGKAIAIYLVLQGVLGVGAAPTITALVVEHVFKGQPDPIGLGMSLTHGTYVMLALLGAILLYRNAKTIATPEVLESISNLIGNVRGVGSV